MIETRLLKSNQIKFICDTKIQIPLKESKILEMWADAQRDGRPAEYRWRPLRKFRNSIPCTTPQSLANACCCSAVQYRCQYRITRDLDVKRILHRAKFRHGARAPEKCIYSVPAQETAKHRAKFGWPPVSDTAAVTKPRRETR